MVSFATQSLHPHSHNRRSISNPPGRPRGANPPDRKGIILDVAERMIRTGGYHGFSFRDIASEIGIKSASIHYHFPSKEDLGEAVAQRYTEKFLQSLGNPDEMGKDICAVQSAMRAAFRRALERDGLICLCGVLSAEQPGLPLNVSGATRDFFERSTDWLMTAIAATSDGAAISPKARQALALALLAQLQGAMLMARAMGGVDFFDLATSKLIAPALEPC